MWLKFSFQLRKWIITLLNLHLLFGGTIVVPKQFERGQKHIARISKLVVDFIEYRRINAITKIILKRSKRDSWRKFCLSLNLNISMSDLWSTARRFKTCVDRSLKVTNEDWFFDFCNKITCYVSCCGEFSLNMV